MKIELHTRERVISAKLPYEGAKFVEVEFPCSACGSKLVAGGAPTVDYDTVTARAACVGCKAHCGTLVVECDTIFGLEEDELVTNGRPRVY